MHSLAFQSDELVEYSNVVHEQFRSVSPEYTSV